MIRWQRGDLFFFFLHSYRQINRSNSFHTCGLTGLVLPHHLMAILSLRIHSFQPFSRRIPYGAELRDAMLPLEATHSRTMSFQTQGSNTSQTKDHERRDSDAMSLKTANLPIPGSDGGSRKSSAATTTTVTPATTIPHFSTPRPVRDTGPIPRPGSGGSLATDDLIRSLKRGNSSSQLSNASSDLQGNSRWGSMISGFWSNKRRDSTSATDITTSPTRSDEVDGSKLKISRSKLTEMVAEAQRHEILYRDEAASRQFQDWCFLYHS